jgi:Kef-type K+ transport system membrane component KefB/nucleotide-binding universal stress UspA family protein
LIAALVSIPPPLLALVREDPSAALSEHQILVFLAQLALLIGFARVLGGVAKMLGQPAVVGELLAGIVLGPSVFGRVMPEAYDWVFGLHSVQSLMSGLAWLGVIFLLMAIGFETDLAIIGRFKKAASWVSLSALLLPLAVGLGLALQAPDDLFAAGADRPLAAGFLALALSVSALPVVAKILQDLGFLRRNFGQITLAAGMSMDAVGWLLLAALSGIALDGFNPRALAVSFGGLILFVAVASTLGRILLDWVMRVVVKQGSSQTAAVTVAVVAGLTGALVTQALRLEAILGAFVMGIVLAGLRHQVATVHTTLDTMTSSVFGPIFFAFSGLRVDVAFLGSPGALTWAGVFLAAAMGAKIIGTFIGGRLAGIGAREALALGSGLSALGAMGVVVAIVGLNLGVLTEAGYTVAVVVAVATSILAPQLLKLVVRGWEVPDEERRRLEREELLASSEILSSKRVLLPTRGGRNSRYAARLLADVLDDPEITVLTVDVTTARWRRLWRRTVASAGRPDDVLSELKDVRHRLVRRVASDPAAAIAQEARLGYDLVLLGASEEERDGPARVFSDVVDRVLARVDLPSVIVRIPRGVVQDIAPPGRVLVPVVGSRVSRAAEELAYSIAKRSAGGAFALHVVNRPQSQGFVLEEGAVDQAMRMGQEMVAAAGGFGERLGVVVETGVRQAPHPEELIVEFANGDGFDLVVIGAANRPMSDRPFFGHRVRYMIERLRIPLAIVTVPHSQK